MRTLLAFSVFCLATAAVTSLHHPESSQEISSHQVKAASQMFAKQCASCHVAPDLRMEVDKAWLNQLYETA